MSRTLRLLVRVIPALCAVVIAPSLVLATTVVRLDLDEVAGDAALVFEGEVVAREAAWNDEHTLIRTAVTFRVERVLKGAIDGDEVTLRFAGGSVGGRAMRVSSMVYPETGERGIYFVEDPDRDLVHPLVGWGQGHFRLIRDDAGIERVTTEAGAPVTAVAGRSAARMAAPAGSAEFSHGVARGLSVGRAGQPVSSALSRHEFLDAIGPRLGRAAGTSAR